MDWVTLGEEIVKLGAPLLGAAISGGAPALVKAALTEAFAVTESDKEIPAEIHAAILANPNASEKLATVEANCAEHLQPPNLAG